MGDGDDGRKWMLVRSSVVCKDISTLLQSCLNDDRIASITDCRWLHHFPTNFSTSSKPTARPDNEKRKGSCLIKLAEGHLGLSSKPYQGQ